MPTSIAYEESFPLASYPKPTGDEAESEGLLRGSSVNDESDHHQSHSFSTPSAIDKLTIALLLSAFVISLLSFGFTLYLDFTPSLARPSTSSSSYYNAAIELLRKPSQYIGLDRVDSSAERFAQEMAHAGSGDGHQASSSASNNDTMTMNPPPTLPVGPGRATSIVRVNSKFPNATFPRDGWVLLTNEDVSLMQFPLPRTTGSSLCTFHISLPTRHSLIRQSRLLTLESPSTVSPILTIYDLTQAPAHNVTWASKPSHGALMRKMNVDFGMDIRTEAFDCGIWHGVEAGEGEGLLAVEIGCEGTGCRVEFREEDGDPLLGMELIAVDR